MPQKKHVSLFNSRLTSTISISLVLLLLGVVVLMGVVAQQLSVYVRENITFSLVLSDGSSSEEILTIRKALAESRYAKDVRYISKAEALAELKEDLGDDPSKFLGFNPLFPSIEVKMYSDYANGDSIAMIEKELRKYGSIRDVLYRKDMVELVSDNIKRITFVLLILALVLMTVSVVLINNTIRLLIHSKRFTIYTMKLVGATDFFIQWPFIRSNIVSGVIAAVLADAALYGLASWVSNAMGGLSFVTDWRMLLLVFGVVLAMGIVLTSTITWLVTSRYLSMKQEKLFLI